MPPTRPQRSASTSNYLTMHGSDDEDDDAAEEKDSSDFDGDEEEDDDESSDDMGDESASEDDSPIAGKKRGKKGQPTPKKAPPAKKPKAVAPVKTPAAKKPSPPSAPATTTTSTKDDDATAPAPSLPPPPPPPPAPSGGGGPTETPVTKPSSSKKKKPTPPSAASSTASSSTSSVEKKKTAPAKKPAAPKKSASSATAPAPKKPAKETGVIKNPTDASSAILDYMNATNRPYGAQNVFDNLHRKIPLGVVKAQLDVLADAGKLSRKEYGKNKIYFAKQEDIDESSMGAEMSTWEAKAKTAKEERARLAKQKAELEATVRGLNESMTDEQLTVVLAQTTKENAEREAKLQELQKLSEKGGQLPAVRGNLETLRATMKKYRSLWIERKRNVMEGLAAVADGRDCKVKTLMDDVGIETDEDYGSLPPPLP